MSKEKKLVIIDTYSLLHRAWHAIPPLTTSKGKVINAAYGFTSILLKLIKELKPDYLAAAFDLAAPTFRHVEFAAYKAQREKQPDALYEQVVDVERILDAFKIPRLSKSGFEADDIIGTIVKHNEKNHPEIKNIIVTGDLDALQLVSKHTSVFTLKKGINDTIIYDRAAVVQRYGLKPEQLIDMKALKGDASDNIPGVKGIGEKGAVDLIKEFGTLEKLYSKIDRADIKERMKTLLQEQKKQALQSKRLVTIVTDVPVHFDLEKSAHNVYNREEVYQIFKELEFSSLLNKIPEPNLFSAVSQESAIKRSQAKYADHYHHVADEQAMKKLAKLLTEQKIFALDTESTGLDTLTAEILGASFSWQAHEGYFVSLRTPTERKVFVQIFKPLLENPAIQKTGHNLKFDYQILKKIGLTLKGIVFDSLIAAFLVNPNRGLKLDHLTMAYFNRRLVSLEDIAEGKGKDLNILKIPEADLSWYAAEDADYAWQLYLALKPELQTAGQERLFNNIEIPLIPVLAEMELAGVSLDQSILNRMAKQFDQRIKKLTAKIYQQAGREFNIASPLQLKEILFEHLQIGTKGIKKTKTGISTASAELDKMMNLHPIIPLISQYRELTKLQSTYITALPKLISRTDNRLHTSFNQTVTATGRLSSSNPNLQNIPIRTEEGRAIRQAFVAKKGHLLLSADYSQIELRLAAHMSADPVMCKSFKKGEDIHRATAAAINKIPLDQVSYDQRRQAKEINFGVIYGLGSIGLAQRTGLTRDEAKDFIAKYFSVYKKLKEYIAGTKELVSQQGYVETLFGRRRYLPEIHSNMPQLVAQAERMAVNMPLQGTAADIMKIAMIRLANSLPKVSPDSTMLLQVHDELVLEVPKKDLAKVTAETKKIMEQVIKLSVPLIADVKAGPNWGSMEPVK